MAIHGLPLAAQNALTLKLSFRIPGVENSIQAEAEIAWCSRDGHAGIRFLHLNESSAAELKRWVLQKQLEEGWTALK
jgi:PilZ domain-containing protein